MPTTINAETLTRVKAVLESLDASRALTYDRFVHAEMGLFEGVLALGRDQAVFVKNRFGTFEAETPIRFADADPRSIRTWESVFGEEVSWMSKGASLRVARLSRDDATDLRSRLSGVAAPAASEPVITVMDPVSESLEIPTPATSAPEEPPAQTPFYPPPPPRVTPPPRHAALPVVVPTTPVGNAVGESAIGELPDGAFASAFLHALVAGAFVSLVGGPSGLYFDPMVERSKGWILFAISFPLAELLFHYVRRRAPNATWARSIGSEKFTVPGSAIRRLVAFAFAGALASLVSVFLGRIVAAQFGEREIFFWLSIAALGAAITWADPELTWRPSALVLAFGGFAGRRFGSALLSLPVGPFLLNHVSFTVVGAWFAYAMWVHHKSRVAVVSGATPPRL